MNIDQADTFERAKRFANKAIWSIELQIKRIRSDEEIDDNFPFRVWVDFHFLLVSMSRLWRAAHLAKEVDLIEEKISKAIKVFEDSLPGYREMRNVAEHIDDYVLGKGRNNNIRVTQLEVASLGHDSVAWLGYQMNLDDALKESVRLYNAIRNCKNEVKDALN